MRPVATATVRAVRSEPMTETPRALPTWRTVVLAPLATPEPSNGKHAARHLRATESL